MIMMMCCVLHAAQGAHERRRAGTQGRRDAESLRNVIMATTCNNIKGMLVYPHNTFSYNLQLFHRLSYLSSLPYKVARTAHIQRIH